MKNEKLKKALEINAAFSTLSGFLMISFNEKLATWMHISYTPIFFLLGLGLLLFAFFLFRTARQKPISAKKVKFIIVQDWLWVIGSILIILTQAFRISTEGYIAIGGVALIVADFALLQHWFLKKSNIQ